MNTDDLAFVNVDVGVDTQPTAILQIVECIGKCFSFDITNQYTIDAGLNLSRFDLAVMVKNGGQDATPEVIVINSERKPIRPRAGIM